MREVGGANNCPEQIASVCSPGRTRGIAIAALAGIDTVRAADLILEPRSTADRSRGAAIAQPTEIDGNRSGDLIREPVSMAVESRAAMHRGRCHQQGAVPMHGGDPADGTDGPRAVARRAVHAAGLANARAPSRSPAVRPHGTAPVDALADLVALMVARAIEATAALAPWCDSVRLAPGFAEDAARSIVGTMTATTADGDRGEPKTRDEVPACEARPRRTISV